MLKIFEFYKCKGLEKSLKFTRKGKWNFLESKFLKTVNLKII